MAKTKTQDEYDSLFTAISAPPKEATNKATQKSTPEKPVGRTKTGKAREDLAKKETGEKEKTEDSKEEQSKEEPVVEQTEEMPLEESGDTADQSEGGKMQVAPKPKGRPKNLYEKARQVVDSTGLDVYISMMAKRKGMFINEWLRSLVLENAARPENKELFNYTDMRTDQVKQEDNRKYGT